MQIRSTRTSIARVRCTYSVPHLVITATPAETLDRPKFQAQGKSVPVERLVNEFFRDQGYKVVKGDEAALFLHVLSANFRNSFFMEVCRNHIGSDADPLSKELDALAEKSINARVITKPQIERASNFLCRYYSGKRQQNLYTSLSQFFGLQPHQLMVSLIRLFRGFCGFKRPSPIKRNSSSL